LINKRIFLIPVLFLLTMFYSCSDSPSSIGNNLLSPDYVNVNKIDSYQDSIGQSSSDYKTQVQLSDSPRLLVGKFNNVVASTLMRFAIFLPDSLKQAVLGSTLNILSARVDLVKEYNIGTSTGSLNYTVHFVHNTWTALYNADSLSLLDYDPADISSNKSSIDSLYSFELDNQTISSWLNAASDTSVKTNNGIYIKPDTTGADRIVGFDAYNVNAIGLPTLTIVVSESGNVDTLKYISLPDVSILTGDKPVLPSGDIAVQAGLAVDARVKFDLSFLQKGAIVNKAQFTVYLDSSATKTGDTYTNSIVAYFAKDSSDTAYDTTSGIVLNRDGNTFTGNIARFIQSIASGYHDNNGFILAAGGQNIAVDLFALKGSDAAETSLRPRLVIIYTGK